MSLDEKEVKEAVELVHEYGCIKAICGGEENQGLINAFQTLIDLAQLYLSIAGKMPEEKKLLWNGFSDDDIESKIFNLARQECILAFVKEKESIYLKGVEDGKEMVRKELSIGQENKHARIEKGVKNE